MAGYPEPPPAYSANPPPPGAAPIGFAAPPPGQPPYPAPGAQPVFVQNPGTSVHVVETRPATTTAYVVPVATSGVCPACRVS